jgi:tRNA(Ile)-lysidine synthase TilS/MesJ
MPISFPNIHLDEHGVCNHCRDFERKFTNWDATREKRREVFEKTITQVKSLRRTYDCCIPLSGGKDSTYALYICDRIYGLKCLAITFDNGFLSDQARGNIDRALLHSSADHIYYSVNRNTMLALYRQFILSTGNLCSACMRGINMVTDFAPKSLNIPLVVTGNGRRNSYLNFIPEVFCDGSRSYFKNVLDEAGTEIRCGPLCPKESDWNLQKIFKAGLKISRIPIATNQYRLDLYDYFEPGFDEIYPTISREMGWEMSDGIYEHSDCILHNVPFYLHTLKFPELSEKTFYLCHQVRLGGITREEAMKQELQLIRDRAPPLALAPFLKEINLSEQEFTEAVRDWRKNQQYKKKWEQFLVSLYHRLI